MSDVHKGYPKFFRLNPIIKWNYDQVWTFIKDFQVPYCSLYDEGISLIIKATLISEIRTTQRRIKHSMMRKFACIGRPTKQSQPLNRHPASTDRTQTSYDTVFESINYRTKLSLFDCFLYYWLIIFE
jgi:3'-phosphoadenosine 5'-phosphosulfate sulfotransferase (PAPS reductase)/FAD synthetase